jgi:hypothetical protein
MGTSNISTIDSADLPYVSHIPLDGRQLVIGPYYDSKAEKWEAYQQVQNDCLRVLRPKSLFDGTYVAVEPEDEESDLRLHFSETIRKYLSLPEVVRYLPEIERDVINALSSIEKYFVILKYGAEEDSHSASQMIASEVEYAFANHRSAYDLLNRVSSEVYSHYHENPATLPDSFRKVAQKEAGELSEKYSLPSQMIKFYKSNEEPFMTLRKVRDEFLHHGRSVRLVFHAEDGFAVLKDSVIASRLSRLKLWPAEETKDDQLLSLLPLFSFLAKDIIGTMKQCAAYMYLSFQEYAPKPIYHEEYRVYIKSRMASHMRRLDDYISKHWLLPEEVLKKKSEV